VDIEAHIIEAIANGDVLKVKHHGGNLPGAVRCGPNGFDIRDE
jgi:hypothetical protein